MFSICDLKNETYVFKMGCMHELNATHKMSNFLSGCVNARETSLAERGGEWKKTKRIKGVLKYYTKREKKTLNIKPLKMKRTCEA